MFLFAQTWAVFLVQIHVSHWISAQHLLTALETVAGGFAGDCVVAWQTLISQSAQLLPFPTSFQDAHKYSIQFLTRGFSTGEMPTYHVDPGEILLSTQTSFHYVLAVLESPFTTQSLFLFVSCFHLFQRFM